jgi:cytochrome c oxidase subunit 2
VIPFAAMIHERVGPGLPLRSASSVAGEVDFIFFALLALSALILAVLTLGIGYYLVRYRAGSSASRIERPLPAMALEGSWILGTVVVFLAIGVWGSVMCLRIARPPPGEALEVYVIGRQWMWEVLHPGGRREHNSLHLPRGRVARLNLVSEDVIHSFYVPAFRLKHDVMPGRYTSFWVEPTETGVFDLFCAEFCGTEHHLMRGSVTVLEPEGYSEWLREGGGEPALAAVGERLFNAHGCSGCHNPRSEVHAPPLEGLYGRAVALDNGRFVEADERYLHDSIMLPNKEVVAGYAPVMPAYQGILREDQVFALIEHIKSLGRTQAAQPAQAR